MGSSAGAMPRRGICDGTSRSCGSRFRRRQVRGGTRSTTRAGALGVAYEGLAKSGDHVYRARWYDPWLGGGRRHRFVLLENGDRPEVATEAFD